MFFSRWVGQGHRAQPCNQHLGIYADPRAAAVACDLYKRRERSQGHADLRRPNSPTDLLSFKRVAEAEEEALEDEPRCAQGRACVPA